MPFLNHITPAFVCQWPSLRCYKIPTSSLLNTHPTRLVWNTISRPRYHCPTQQVANRAAVKQSQIPAVVQQLAWNPAKMKNRCETNPNSPACATGAATLCAAHILCARLAIGTDPAGAGPPTQTTPLTCRSATSSPQRRGICPAFLMLTSNSFSLGEKVPEGRMRGSSRLIYSFRPFESPPRGLYFSRNDFRKCSNRSCSIACRISRRRFW